MEIQKPIVPDFCADKLLKMRVIVYYFDGMPQTEIVKKVNVLKGTVSKWLSDFKKTGEIFKTKEKTGRPAKFNDEIQQMLVDLITESPYITQEEISEQIFARTKIKIAQQTISTYLSQLGSYKIPQKVPILSEKNREKRLSYARFHLNDKFSNVIFSDESRFQVYSNTRKVFVFKGDDSPQKPMNNPNYSVMVWGAISKKGKINLTFVEGTMNKEKYIETLNFNLLPSAAVFGNAPWRFQQDNAPCHKAYVVKQFLQDNVPKILWHPPQSPDLNPIELVWGIMKKYVEKENPKNKSQLKQAIFKAWNKISKETCIDCIDHVRKTLDLVIKKEGSFIG